MFSKKIKKNMIEFNKFKTYYNFFFFDKTLMNVGKT
jgi:hypothetical protein